MSCVSRCVDASIPLLDSRFEPPGRVKVDRAPNRDGACVRDRPVLPRTLTSLFPQPPLGAEYSTSIRLVGFHVLVSCSFSHNSTHSRSFCGCAALFLLFFTRPDPSLPDSGYSDLRNGSGPASKSPPSSNPTTAVLNGGSLGYPHR